MADRRARNPVVRKADLTRVLDVLAARGVTPAAFDVLPGGGVRLHAVAPAASDAAAEQRGAEAWDAALGLGS